MKTFKNLLYMGENNLFFVLLLLFSFFWIIWYVLFKKRPFVNLKKVIADYWKIFDHSWGDKITFAFLPIVAAIGISGLYPVSIDILNVFSTDISILLGLLFASLGALSSYAGIIPKENSYSEVFNETITVIIYLGTISITTLLAIFVGIIMMGNERFSEGIAAYIIDFIITIVYYGVFSILLNCLVVFKRIGKLIQIKNEE